MLKKIIFYALLITIFAISAYIVLNYFAVSNPLVILFISFVLAFVSRKLISFIVYGNFKEKSIIK